MKLKIVSKRDEIPTLNPSEKFVHLGFRPSSVDFINLIQRCPGLRMIQMPHTYYKTMSKISQFIFQQQDIVTLEGDVWGYRKDINDDFIINDATLEEIRRLAGCNVSIDDIASQMKEKIRISPDLIKYIIER